MTTRRVAGLNQVWTLGGLTPLALARHVLRQMSVHDTTGYAAQLAYYFLFSVFPFFLFLTALLAYVPVADLLDTIMAMLAEFVPQEVLTLMQENVFELVTRQQGGLLSIGIAMALWLASNATAAVINSLNHAYGVSEGRPYWKVRAVALALTVAVAGLIVMTVVLLLFSPMIGGWLAERIGLGAAFDTAWEVLRWTIMLLSMILGAALLYYFAPDVEQQWRWITPGSVFAVLLWVPAALGFGYYVEQFGAYNKTYGSIGAVIVLLTWMYLSGLFLLIGGEINAGIEHAAANGKAPGKKTLS